MCFPGSHVTGIYFIEAVAYKEDARTLNSAYLLVMDGQMHTVLWTWHLRGATGAESNALPAEQHCKYLRGVVFQEVYGSSEGGQQAFDFKVATKPFRHMVRFTHHGLLKPCLVRDGAVQNVDGPPVECRRGQMAIVVACYFVAPGKPLPVVQLLGSDGRPSNTIGYVDYVERSERLWNHTTVVVSYWCLVC